MDTLKNLQIVAGFLFYLIGFWIFILVFLIKNQFYGEWPLVLLKSIDLPFALNALLYGGTSLKLSLGENTKTDMLDAILIFLGVFCFVLVIYLNFAFVDFI